MKKEKKAVSVMIGYVLLIASAAVLGIIVYSWLKGYVPGESVSCPDGVSILVKEKSTSSDWLNFTVKNNGKFSIGGFLIQVSVNEEDELATKDISKYLNVPSPLEGFVILQPGENSLDPNEEIELEFNLTSFDEDNIYLVAITPARFQNVENKPTFVSCGNFRIQEEILWSK